MASSRWLVIVTLAAVLQSALSADASRAQIRYCEDPKTRPTRIAFWSEGLPSEIFDIATDGSHVFIQDLNTAGIHRYSMDGQTHDFWPLPPPWGVHLTIAQDGDLYAWNNYDGLYVLDPNGSGTPKAVLFAGPRGSAPGLLAGGPIQLESHPETGDIYVLDQFGIDEGGEEATWVSRIQRFDANGNFIDVFVENALEIPEGDPEYDVSPPTPPACGAWHYALRIRLDDDDVYLVDFVNFAGELVVLHKFDSTGQCVDQWDITGRGFAVARDGYFYEHDGSPSIYKKKPDFSTLVYGGDGAIHSLGPVSGTRLFGKYDEFLLVFARYPAPPRIEIYGPKMEPLNFIGTSFQEPAPPFGPKQDLTALTECDEGTVAWAGVVADGVSPLLLRWKVPGPGLVKWELQDPEALFPDDLPVGVGTLSDLQASTTGTTIEASVEVLNGEYYAFSIYTSPKEFDRPFFPHDDGTKEKRPIRIVCHYRHSSVPAYEMGTVEGSLKVYRPPVLLVHGWMGDAGSWRHASFPDTRFRTHRADYRASHGRSLQHHLDNATINRECNSTRTLMSADYVVAAQVDVATHSMGGLHVRKWTESTQYRGARNLDKGDFHKLLFLNTPHEGAPMANLLVDKRDVIRARLNQAVPEDGMSKRVSSFFQLTETSRTLSGEFEQLIADGVDDLAAGSSAIAGLQETVAPIHSHVGDASSFWSIFTPPAERVFWAKQEPLAAIAWFVSMFADYRIPEPSDLIVPVASQEGGLSGGHLTTTVQLPASIHTAATRSDQVDDLLQLWALTPTDVGSFFAQSIPAPGGAGGGAPASATTLVDAYEDQPEFSGRYLEITLVDPANGLVEAGQTIELLVDQHSRPGFKTGDLDTMVVFYPGGALFTRALKYVSGQYVPNTARITVPLDHVGPFDVSAIIVGAFSRRIKSSRPLTIDVEPGAVLTGIRVEPSSVQLSGPGDSQQLRVIGEYSDAIERDLSAAVLDTEYQANGTSAKVLADGVVVGSNPGAVTITVTNETYSVQVAVTVDDGTQENNPPHANAGSSYAACDSQIVYLDGSDSYDVDEAIGDALSYEWDLDADGEFDDATGETPSVQLLFPGEWWLIGLRVTDTAGAESVDYAYLEAGPGCLDGDYVCSVTRTEPGTVSGIGVDGTGSVYRAEYSFGGFPERIVKYSSQCAAPFNVIVPAPLGRIAVAVDGTIYLAANDGIVRRYLGDGTPLTPITLSDGDVLDDIEVDASGHLYTNDAIGNDDVVRKFNQTGALIATWNVDQTTGGEMSRLVGVGSDEAVYVSLSGDRLARGVLQAGVYVLDWVIGGTGVDPGFFQEVTDVAVGPSGRLYVCDHLGHRVQVFNDDGTFVRLWVGSGQTDGGFRLPEFIAVGAQEQLIVMDNPTTGGDRVQIMGAENTYVDAELAAYTRTAEAPTLLQPHPATPAAGCPQGDDDELVITVALDPASVTGVVPKADFNVTIPSGGDAVVYVPVEADSDAVLVDGKYRTSVTLRQFGGCVAGDLIVRLNGSGIGAVAIEARSPDILTTGSSYGLVGTGDFAKFGTFYQPNYGPCADYRIPFGVVGSNDFAHFGAHYNHNTGDASLRLENAITTSATLRVNVEERVLASGGRRLYASLSAGNLEPFKALVASVRSGNPRLRFLGWVPDAVYPARSLGAEVTRDGEKQIFIGVFGAAKTTTPTVNFGRAEFEVLGGEVLSLTDEDFEFLIADLQVTNGGQRAFSGLRVERPGAAPTYTFELAQNFPNPFNPSTTLAYSLATDSDVSLVIFDVRGARIKTIVEGRERAGLHRASWDGTNDRGARVSSGVYFYRLVAGNFHDTKKMVLLR